MLPYKHGWSLLRQARDLTFDRCESVLAKKSCLHVVSTLQQSSFPKNSYTSSSWFITRMNS